jgi:hypothetical protein
MPGMREERAGGGLDQVAPAERVSRPLQPAPVKGQRSRHSGEGAAPGCGGAAVEQAGGTEDERAGANRGDTKRVEAHGKANIAASWTRAPRRGRHRRSSNCRAAHRQNCAGRRQSGRRPRAAGPAACAIVTASIAGRMRAAIETTPIVPATSIGSTPS